MAIAVNDSVSIADVTNSLKVSFVFCFFQNYFFLKLDGLFDHALYLHP